MMTSQILKYVYFRKTQKSRISRKKHYFFFKYKNLLIRHKGYFAVKNSFVTEVTFNALTSSTTIDKSSITRLFLANGSIQYILLHFKTLYLIVKNSDTFQTNDSNMKAVKSHYCTPSVVNRITRINILLE